jgi:hypothetical protein
MLAVVAESLDWEAAAAAVEAVAELALALLVHRIPAAVEVVVGAMVVLRAAAAARV